MRVRITVENGDQDVEVARDGVEFVGGGARAANLRELARVLDTAVADVRRACDLPARDVP